MIVTSCQSLDECCCSIYYTCMCLLYCTHVIINDIVVFVLIQHYVAYNYVYAYVYLSIVGIQR